MKTSELLRRLNTDVENGLQELSSIEDQILQLISVRNATLFELNRKCIETNVCNKCIKFSHTELYDAYCKDGFNSEIVKKAVANVRKLFFNDSDERFQKFFCIKIEHTIHDYHSKFLRFCFDDGHEHCFKISFDISTHDHDDLLTTNYFNNRIYFISDIRNNFYPIKASFDPDVIKEAISNWIENDFEHDERVNVNFNFASEINYLFEKNSSYSADSEFTYR